MEANGLPIPVRDGGGTIKAQHVQTFIIHLLEHKSAGTAGNRHRALHCFFKWAVAEEEIAAHPMANMPHR